LETPDSDTGLKVERSESVVDGEDKYRDLAWIQDSMVQDPDQDQDSGPQDQDRDQDSHIRENNEKILCTMHIITNI